GAVSNIEGDDRYSVSFEKARRVFLDVPSLASRRFGMLSVPYPSCPLSPSGYQFVKHVRDNGDPLMKLLCAAIQTRIHFQTTL
ncbi:unnamed protein product, partial [Haemonchus placei]|uniref:HECT domain-containing protein n=1 Tax=Haemonchus placei TaxID=6290 RepID=A0A0N4WTM5_HAEPC